MRKYRRMLLVLLTLLVVPSLNALDMSCFPARYEYINRKWVCEVNMIDSNCIVCYAVITVPG